MQVVSRKDSFGNSIEALMLGQGGLISIAVESEEGRAVVVAQPPPRGQSPRTYKALVALAKAMAEDNASGRGSELCGKHLGEDFLPNDPVTGQVSDLRPWQEWRY